MDIRAQESLAIKKKYEDAIEALRQVGYLLRKTEAGRFIWAGNHKTAIAGLKATLRILKNDVPTY